MCNKDKCFYCIPVKTACLVLAFINAIGNGLMLLWCCFVGFFVLALGSSGDSWDLNVGGVRFSRDLTDALDNTWLPLEYWLPVFTLFSLLTLIFSALLCYGICHRRWNHVKAYLIYGSVITVLGVVASIIQLCMDHQPELGLWGLLGCALHTWFLILVHYTYQQLLADAGFANHIRLGDFEDTSSLI